MLDLTDITSTLKKRGKQATDLALKPVKFVASPLVKANDSLKKTMFGPDMHLLAELMTQEQQKLFDQHYNDHLTKLQKKLNADKIAAKKSQGFIHACKLIAAAPDKNLPIDTKVETMQGLFDELRFACKEGLPNKLREDTQWQVDKKSSYTSDEFSHISDAIATAKTFLNQLEKKLNSDMNWLYLTQTPEHNTMIQNIQEANKHLGEEQKVVQDALWAQHEQTLKGKDCIRKIVDICEKIKQGTTEESSLLSLKKKKVTSSDLLKQLQDVIHKDFSKREKEMIKSATEQMKKQQEADKKRNEHLGIWPVFHKTWKTFHDKKLQEAKHSNANFKKGSKALTNSRVSSDKQLSNSITAIIKVLIKPYTNTEGREKQEKVFEESKKNIHTAQIALASHQRLTGVHAEIPEISNGWIVEQRASFLMEYITLLRLQIFHNKMEKRILSLIESLLKNYRDRLDAKKVYAKDILKTPLIQLHKQFTTIQESIKLYEKNLKTLENSLTEAKQEVRDTISYKRLIEYKRTYYQDTTQAILANDFSKETKTLHSHLEELIKKLESSEKEISKQLHLDETALDDQEKTVTIVKNKEQKTKLETLKKQVAGQKTLLKSLHICIDTIKSEIQELSTMSSKYSSHSKAHNDHATHFKQLAESVSKKLKKSSLNTRVNCSASVSSPF